MSEEEKCTVEEWAKAKDTPAWAFAAAKAFHRWPIGLVMSGQSYDEAVGRVVLAPVYGAIGGTDHVAKEAAKKGSK